MSSPMKTLSGIFIATSTGFSVLTAVDDSGKGKFLSLSSTGNIVLIIHSKKLLKIMTYSVLFGRLVGTQTFENQLFHQQQIHPKSCMG